MADLKNCSEYCKIEFEDPALEPLFRAAKKYAENAGIPERENDELYDLLINMLTKHWYDNREAVVMSTKTSEPEMLPVGIYALIHQLR